MRDSKFMKCVFIYSPLILFFFINECNAQLRPSQPEYEYDSGPVDINFLLLIFFAISSYAYFAILGAILNSFKLSDEASGLIGFFVLSGSVVAGAFTSIFLYQHRVTFFLICIVAAGFYFFRKSKENDSTTSAKNGSEASSHFDGNTKQFETIKNQEYKVSTSSEVKVDIEATTQNKNINLEKPPKDINGGDMEVGNYFKGKRKNQSQAIFNSEKKEPNHVEGQYLTYPKSKINESSNSAARKVDNLSFGGLSNLKQSYGIVHLRNKKTKKNIVYALNNVRGNMDLLLSLLRKKKSTNVQLQQDFDKYGADSFEIVRVQYAPDLLGIKRKTTDVLEKRGYKFYPADIDVGVYDKNS